MFAVPEKKRGLEKKMPGIVKQYSATVECARAEAASFRALGLEGF